MVDLEAVLEQAGASSSLGAAADTALRRVLNGEAPGGVVLLHGLDIGSPGVTPATPEDQPQKDADSESALLKAAVQLGEPVGYRPENGGRIVQNLVPVAADSTRQTSTSSAVRLGWHTETAFHPHMPNFLVLLCLKGDPAASTTFSCVDDMVERLDSQTIRDLGRSEFRTGIDESFTDGRAAEPSAPHAVLFRDPERGTWSLRWDELLTQGITPRAAAALATLGPVVDAVAQAVVLEAGDLLVIDNARAVHGRSPFRPRFDGTDRWLQRAFVVDDLGPSAGERVGRVISTNFA